MTPLLLAATLAISSASGPVVVDGALDEPAWASAARVDRFYEIQPGENTEPPVKTEAFITYDQQYFYVGFKCYDPEPGRVLATLGQHDSTYGDDNVGIFLDTFHDQRRGYEFVANSLGVMTDCLRSENNGEDCTWDTIWAAAGRRTDFGYTVEIAIPFKSLRFEDKPEQTWGFILFRDYPRSLRRQISNMPFDRNKNCFLCQWPTLTGLAGIRPSHSIELIPQVTVQRNDERPEGGAPMAQGDVKTEGSLNAAWGITPNLTLNATLNPDFSQVEADTEQLTVNTRFALFFAEKRPFFMEGSDYFATPFSVVYTRSIADPDWGVKFTGKEGRNAYGVIVSDDATTNLLVPSNQRTDLVGWDHGSLSGIFRLRRDVGENSAVGLIATQRQGDGYHNTVLGLDGRFHLADSDNLILQGLVTDTAYPDFLGLAEPGDRLKGEAIWAEYDHSARDWYWNLQYQQRSPEFRTDLGFEPRVDMRRGQFLLYRNWYGAPGAFFNHIQAGTYGRQVWDYEGTLTDRELGLADILFEMPWQSQLNFGVERDLEWYEGTAYHKWSPYIWLRMVPFPNFRNFIQFVDGDRVDYANNRLGKRRDWTWELDWQPERHVEVAWSFKQEQLAVDQGTVFTARLYVVHLYYFFSSRIYLRGLVQFVDVARDPSLYTEPVSARDRTWQSQFLFTYQINPFTMAYVGYSDAALQADAVDRTTTNRAFFVKLSYAFRP